MLAMPDYC